MSGLLWKRPGTSTTLRCGWPGPVISILSTSFENLFSNSGVFWSFVLGSPIQSAAYSNFSIGQNWSGVLSFTLFSKLENSSALICDELSTWWNSTRLLSVASFFCSSGLGMIVAMIWLSDMVPRRSTICVANLVQRSLATEKRQSIFAQILKC